MTDGRIDTLKGIRIPWFLFSLRNPESLAWDQAPLKRKVDKGVKRHQKLASEASRAEYSLRNPKFHQRLKSDSNTHWQRIWNPVRGIWNPESKACNPEYKTLLDYLTWGESDADAQAIIISYNDVTRPLDLSMTPGVMWLWAPLKYRWLNRERCAVWLLAVPR